MSATCEYPGKPGSVSLLHAVLAFIYLFGFCFCFFFFLHLESVVKTLVTRKNYTLHLANEPAYFELRKAQMTVTDLLLSAK